MHRYVCRTRKTIAESNFAWLIFILEIEYVFAIGPEQ